MKIIDSFIFYNELDLLFYRLSILDEYVDFFILVESTHTFSGHSKPLFFMENRERFAKFMHKIIHIIVSDCPFTFPNINYIYNQQWENEYHQRNCIKRGLNSIENSISDDDILLTSDVDEIPNPSVLKNAINGTLIFDANTLNRLALDMYYYNLYNRIGEGSNWHGVKLMRIHAYKNMGLSFQQMRLLEHTYHVPIIPNGGWHLSYFGDIDFIIKKIASYSHQEYNNHKYIDKDILEKNIKNGINILNNSTLVYIPISENANLPYKYDIYLKNYY